MKKLFFLVVVLAQAVFAKELIVNSASGPFKTVQEAADAAEPGDTVVVMPGTYRESVRLTKSGTEDKPIIFLSKEKRQAVVDGSEALTGWKKLAKAEDATGNPNWKNIFYAEVSDASNAFNANLHEDEALCSLAQDPAPEDLLNYDDYKNWPMIPEEGYTSSQMCLPEDKRPKASNNHFDGALIFVWSAPNKVYPRYINSYDSKTGTLSYPEAGKHINGKKDRFAVANHLDYIRRPGDYVVKVNPTTGKNTLWYWPRKEANLEAGKVTISMRRKGFDINGQSYIHIKDFKVRQYAAMLAEYSGCGIYNKGLNPVKGMLVSGNEVSGCRSTDQYWAIMGGGFSDSIIENNFVHDNQLNRGIGVTGNTANPARNNIVRDNIVTRCGGTAINFYHAHDSKMLNNRVYDVNGHHANGLTVYLFSKNCLLEGNIVVRSNMALTIQESSEITVRNNIFIANSPAQSQSRLAASYNDNDKITLLNNTFIGAKVGITIGKKCTSNVFRDNIINVFATSNNIEPEEGTLLENNIFFNKPNREWGESNIVSSEDSVFENAETGDLRRKPGSPLPKAGGPSIKVDLTPIPGTEK